MSTAHKQRQFLFARIWCVPAILVIVACIHLNQWHTLKRSSWGTGAGFGMFATVDYHGSRFVYCVADTNFGQIELAVPNELNNTAGLVARTIPSDRNLLRLAEELFQQEWYLDVDQNDLTFGNSSPEKPNPEKRLDVYSLDLKIGGMQIHSSQKKITTHVVNSVNFRPSSEQDESGKQDLIANLSAGGTTDDENL